MPSTTNKAVSSTDAGPQEVADAPKKQTKGRAADVRTPKVPTDKPVSAVEGATDPDTEGSEQKLPDSERILGTTEVPQEILSERAAKMKEDAKQAKLQAKKDALTIDDVADDAPTHSAADFSFDVRPDFQSMDEENILRFMRHLTGWLRDRDAVVRGPKVTEHQVPDTTVAAVTREGGVGPDPKKAMMTVYEGFYEWEYEGSYAPVTIRKAHVTHIEALRDTATEAMVRRYEV
jgi:hypothetical protein